MDPLVAFKEAQKQGWSTFGPLETFTTPTAARLVKYAGIRSGQRVLDVGCGTGVVSVTAARLGAKVTGLDLTPELLEQAKENARIARVEITWREGDAEQLPFADRAFDVVVSQFGHMFAPRPDVAIAEMLRVLEPGGTIAFSTWPPDFMMGRMFSLSARYLPPPPPGVSPPVQWGDPNVVRQRLGAAVRDLAFDQGLMTIPALSPQHHRERTERTSGPVRRMIEALANDPEKLEAYRAEYDANAAEFFEDNVVRQNYLMTRAIKV
jgi:SAM-dependent methyltransferase